LSSPTQPQSAVSVSSLLSPTVGQLVLCPTPTIPSQFVYQSAPMTVATAQPTSASSQLCTVLGPLLQVPALVQSVQVMPAAVGVPINPVFVAGSVSDASSLFMVPN